MRIRLILPGVVALVACVWAASRAGAWLVVTRPVDRCDLMVVPGGGARERVSTAVDLFLGGACDAVLLTGGPERAGPEGIAEFVTELPQGALVKAPWISNNTVDDALLTRRVASTMNARHIIIVTSPYHTRRTLLAFDWVLAEPGVEVGVFPSASFYMDVERWWTNDYGRRAVVGEYGKLAVTLVLASAAKAAVFGCAAPASPGACLIGS